MKTLTSVDVAKLLRPISEVLAIKFVLVEDLGLACSAAGRDLSGCPFDCAAIDFKNRNVVFEKGCLGSSLIHEMGHLEFGIGESSNEPNEWEWHGWELRVARSIGIENQFYLQNSDYMVDERGVELGSLSAYKRDKYFSGKISEAKAKGLYEAGFES